MKNFRRALYEALRFWPSLLIATLCSMAVAVLWGGNILAFYPILEVTLNGETMQSWVDREIVKQQGKVDELNRQIDEWTLQRSQPQADLATLDWKLRKAQEQLLIDQGSLIGRQKIKPWVDRWVPADPFRTVAIIVAVLMVSTLIKQLFMAINEYLVGRASVDIAMDLRQRIFEKSLALDRANFARIGPSGFTTQITQVAEGLSLGLINTLGGAVREPMRILSCLVGAGLICYRLLFISMLIAPIVGFLLVALTRRLKQVSHRMLVRSTSYHDVMLESLGNIQTVQAYTMEEHEAKRFRRATNDVRSFVLKFVFYSGLTKPLIEFLGLGMLCITIIGGSYLVLNHQTHLLGIRISNDPLTVTQLLIFFAALVGASDPLRKLSSVYSSIYAGSVAADVLYPLLDQPVQIKDPTHPVELPKRHQKIILDHVSFSYRDDSPILQDVSLEIPFGQSVAIVGHNGGGKSTLVNLLCRFYDPVQGSVRFDDCDLRTVRIHDLRRRIALVTQHTELFNNTIKYNIAYGQDHVTDEQVLEAAKQAHAFDFISKQLPEQFGTKVGINGQRLSGGQRQRIALARALLRDPEILILDEATSQIDMVSEQLIRDSLAEHRGRRTMIIITHREALLSLADVVYEVRGGKLEIVRHPESIIETCAAISQEKSPRVA